MNEYIEYKRNKFFKNSKKKTETVQEWREKVNDLKTKFKNDDYITYKLEEWKNKEREKIKSEYVYSIVKKIESILYKSTYTITYDILIDGGKNIKNDINQNDICMQEKSKISQGSDNCIFGPSRDKYEV